MKQCENCRQELEDGLNYCFRCGSKVTTPKQTICSEQDNPMGSAPETWNNLAYGDNITAPVPVQHKIPGRQKSKKKAFVALSAILGIMLLTGAAVFWFFTKDNPRIEIQDYYPKSGSQGTYVLMELNQFIHGDDIEVFYGSEQIVGSRVMNTAIVVNVPLNARSDDILVRYKGGKAKVPFTVLEEERVVLSKEKVEPSSEVQSIHCTEDVTITLPGNFIQEERTITVARVDNPSVMMDSPFGLPVVYDISIDKMAQLPENIQISMKYDPEWFDEGTRVEDYLEPRRWDAENKVWVELFYRVDEDTQTVHFLTDHLSFFNLSIKSVKFMGLAKAGLTVGTAAYGLEWLANDVHISNEKNVRILYSKKAINEAFPDSDWEKVMSGGTLRTPSFGYGQLSPVMVQDIGSILETSLKAYIEAGFEDPTQNRFGGSIFTRRIKVKIDSYWNFYGAGEFNYTALWDQINIPSEIIRYEVFEPVLKDPSVYQKAELFLTHILAHELFHVIQRPFYGSLTDYRKGRHLWWMEASADYAANDIAWKRTGTLLNERIGSRFFDYPLNSTGKKPASFRAGSDLEYEYLSAIFVRFLKQKIDCDFQEIVQFVAEKGLDDEPMDAIAEYAMTEAGYQFDFTLLYMDFVIWMLEQGHLTIADFDQAGRDVVAEKSQPVTIPNEKTTVILEKQEVETGVVSVFKATGRTDGSQSGLEFVTVLHKPVMDFEMDVETGDVLYFIAPNGTGVDRHVSVAVKLNHSEKEEEGKLAEHAFVVGKDATAKIWAVKMETGHWRIDPDEVEEGQFNQEYEFVIHGENVSKEIKEVRIEYDFGDGGKNAKGSVAGTVNPDGTVETGIQYVYEIPEKRKNEEEIEYTVTARIMNGDSQIGSVKASVKIKPIDLFIKPPRIVTYELAEGATEAEHTFEAVVTPEGAYRFEWDFGDGTAKRTTEGKDSIITHTYQKVGTFHPQVTLYTREGNVLAKDSITVILEKALVQKEDPFRKYDEGYIKFDYSKLRYEITEDTVTYYNIDTNRIEGMRILFRNNDLTEVSRIDYYDSSMPDRGEAEQGLRNEHYQSYTINTHYYAGTGVMRSYEESMYDQALGVGWVKTRKVWHESGVLMTLDELVEITSDKAIHNFKAYSESGELVREEITTYKRKNDKSGYTFSESERIFR